MHQVLLGAQIFVSIVLILLILLQVKGTGFGRVWGGLSVHSSRRGFEGLVFRMTFVFAFTFVLISILTLYIS